MHYVGMTALRLPAIANWDKSYIIASVAVALLFSALAFSVHKHSLGLWPRVQSSALLALGILGLHFIGMAAVTYIPDPSITIPDQAVPPEWLAIAVSAVTCLIVGLGLVGSLADEQLAERNGREAERLRMHIDELEKTKAELMNAVTAAASASRAKSQFLANMGHELRTPLNAVIGFSDILKNQLFGPIANERYVSCAADIHNSGIHLLGIINDILDLSRIDSTDGLQLNEELVDLQSTIAKCIADFEEKAKHGRVDVQFRSEDILPLLRADSRRVRQIVAHLLGNAIKFTRPGGRVDVVLSTGAEGLSVTFSDNGVGIERKDLDRILQPFVQGESGFARKHEGAGLGLPLAKGLVEMHGGALMIESEPGVGTTARVVMPTSRLQRVPAAA
jgi:signal transduction histidine kinase